MIASWEGPQIDTLVLVVHCTLGEVLAFGID